MYLLLVLLWLVGLVFYLMALVRTWRISPLLAVLMFLFWPVGIYVLVKYWNEGDGPRMPLLASLGTSVLALLLVLMFMPRLHLIEDEGPGFDEAITAPADEDLISRNARRARALANLPRRNDTVTISDAPIAINPPAHFHFIDREALMQAFGGTVDEPAASTIGWFVHERVDLTGKRAWHVEIDYFGDGYVANSGLAGVATETLRADAQAAMNRQAELLSAEPDHISAYAELPSFDPRTARATWVEEVSKYGRGEPMLDCYALQLGRKGVALLSISSIDPTRQELCLRSVRMLAAHVQFGRGQEYADHSRMLDRSAPYALGDLISGAFIDKR